MANTVPFFFMSYKIVGKEKRMKYIRVEGYNRETKETVGGFISASLVLMARLLYVHPYQLNEELFKTIDPFKQPEAYKLMMDMSYITGEMPIPEEYLEDKQNRYCMYSPNAYRDAETVLIKLSKDLKKKTYGRFCLVVKSFDLSKRELLYTDKYQCVVSKETYDKYNNDSLITKKL